MSTYGGPAELVLDTFARTIAAGLGLVEVERNAPEPVDLEVDVTRVVLIDGGEDPAEVDPLTGYSAHVVHADVEAYIKTRAKNVGGALNELLVRIRAAAVADRTLGGVLYGKAKGDGTDRPHFDGLELAEVSRELYREPGAEHGGCVVQGFRLRYATPPDDPGTIVRFGGD